MYYDTHGNHSLDCCSPSSRFSQLMADVGVIPPDRPIAGLISHRGTELSGGSIVLLQKPEASETHKPIPHAALIQAVIETLGFRKLAVVQDQ